jgi:hypothetical protein
MTFESDRIAQEKHDRIQQILRTRFAQMPGNPRPEEIIALVNAAIGEVEPAPTELVYDYEMEESP